MKWLTLVSVLSMLMLFSSIPANAQSAENFCGQYGCGLQTSWSTPQWVDFILVCRTGGTCSCRVVYQTRQCNPLCEIFITRIEKLTGCSCGIEDLFGSAVHTILININLIPGVPPGCGPTSVEECSYNTRVSTGGCWQDYGGAYTICENAECCAALYKVCMDAFGNINYTQLYAPTNGTCSVGTLSPCALVCDDFPTGGGTENPPTFSSKGL